MSLFTLYLLTRLEELKYFFKDTIGLSMGLTVTCAIMFGIVCFAGAINNDWDEDGYTNMRKITRKYFTRLSILTVFLMFFNVLVPNNKQAAFIVGGYYVTNNEDIKKLPNNIIAASNAFLSEYAGETKAATKEVVKEAVIAAKTEAKKQLKQE